MKQTDDEETPADLAAGSNPSTEEFHDLSNKDFIVFKAPGGVLKAEKLVGTRLTLPPPDAGECGYSPSFKVDGIDWQVATTQMRNAGPTFFLPDPQGVLRRGPVPVLSARLKVTHVAGTDCTGAAINARQKNFHEPPTDCKSRDDFHTRGIGKPKRKKMKKERMKKEKK